MRLVDTSAWVDYLRGAGSPAARRVRDLLVTAAAGDVVTCEPIAMELLAGATSATLQRMEALVDGLPTLSLDPRLDFRTAAAIYRTGRQSGRTIRSLTDCLIASIALRHDVEILHKDAGFDVIAGLVPLRVVSLREERATPPRSCAR